MKEYLNCLVEKKVCRALKEMETGKPASSYEELVEYQLFLSQCRRKGFSEEKIDYLWYEVCKEANETAKRRSKEHTK